MGAFAFTPAQSGAHAQKTSTGTADVQTFSSPNGAKGVYITAVTNGCYLTFDGTAPSSSNGLAIPTGSVVFIACANTMKVASQAAGNSVVSVLWVS